jgi:hypothetical protein
MNELEVKALQEEIKRALGRKAFINLSLK